MFSANGNLEIFCFDLNSNKFAYLLDGSGPLWSPTGEKFLFTSVMLASAVPYFGLSRYYTLYIKLDESTFDNRWLVRL